SHDGKNGRNKDKGWEENAHRRENRSRESSYNVPNESCGRENRSRGELAHSHSVEDLVVSKPAQVINKVVAQKCQKHIAGAEDHRTALQKSYEQRRETEGDRNHSDNLSSG